MRINPRIAALVGALLLLALGAAWYLASRAPSQVAPGVPPAVARPVGEPRTRSPAPIPLVPVTAASPPSAQAVESSPSVNVSSAPVPSRPAAMPAAPAPSIGADTPEERAAAEIDLDQVKLMLRDYRTRMGDNPVGTNAEIMRAVMGGNPKGAQLGPPEGQDLNERGELVDRWGSPVFFHQLSATHMEIHSAGPDRVLGTDDDIVMK